MKYPDGIEMVLGDGIEWLKAQPDHSLDGLMTDPPWGSGPDIAGQVEWLELLTAMEREAERVLRPRSPVLLWFGVTRFVEPLRVLKRLRYRLLIGVHQIPPRGFVLSPPIALSLSEVVLWMDFGGSRAAKGGVNLLQQASTGRRDTGHVCYRRLDVARKIASTFWAPGAHIVDPFGGSATIACAAADIGIRCTSVEIDPAMHATAVMRAEGRTPNLICPVAEHGSDASLFDGIP